jgi:hypothetical protein
LFLVYFGAAIASHALYNVRGVTATLPGFSTFNNEKGHEISWAQMAIAFFLTPLRPELDRPWLETVVRFGPVGGEESFMDPGSQNDKMLSTTFRPTISGELYVFLNDAVIRYTGPLFDVMNVIAWSKNLTSAPSGFPICRARIRPAPKRHFGATQRCGRFREAYHRAPRAGLAI